MNENPEKLYVNIPIPNTLVEFITDFYSKRKNEVGYAVSTFLDPKCTNLHCNRSRRSFDDLFIVATTYFPDTTPKELMKAILDVKIIMRCNGIDYKIYPQLYCCGGMMRNRLLYCLPSSLINPFAANQYNSQYSWAELLKMVGINDYQEYRKYIGL